MGEAIQDGNAHMQLHQLPLKGTGQHPLAHAFEAVHLGFRQAAPVVAAPLFPYPVPQAFASQNSLVAHPSADATVLPKRGILTWWNDRLGTTQGNRIMAASAGRQWCCQ